MAVPPTRVSGLDDHSPAQQEVITALQELNRRLDRNGSVFSALILCFLLPGAGAMWAYSAAVLHWPWWGILIAVLLAVVVLFGIVYLIASPLRDRDIQRTAHWFDERFPVGRSDRAEALEMLKLSYHSRTGAIELLAQLVTNLRDTPVAAGGMRGAGKDVDIVLRSPDGEPTPAPPPQPPPAPSPVERSLTDLLAERELAFMQTSRRESLVEDALLPVLVSAVGVGLWWAGFAPWICALTAFYALLVGRLILGIALHATFLSAVRQAQTAFERAFPNNAPQGDEALWTLGKLAGPAGIPVSLQLSIDRQRSQALRRGMQQIPADPNIGPPVAELCSRLADEVDALARRGYLVFRRTRDLVLALIPLTAVLFTLAGLWRDWHIVAFCVGCGGALGAVFSYKRSRARKAVLSAIEGFDAVFPTGTQGRREAVAVLKAMAAENPNSAAMALWQVLTAPQIAV